MRVRGLLPGVAAAGALALPGCGSGDDVRTVTVAEPATEPPARTTTVDGRSDGPAATPGGPEPRPRTTTVTTTETVAGEPATTTVVARPRPRPGGGTDADPRAGTDDVIEPADPIGGTTVLRGTDRGTGYTVRVPDGWNDGAKRLEGSSVDLDRTYVKGRGDAVTSSILVVRTVPEDARRRGIDGLAPQIRRELSGLAGGVRAMPGPRRVVDGEDAVTFVLRRRLGGTEIVQRQVSVVRRGALYTVGLTAKSASYAADARVFARFLDSWRWR